MAVTRICSVEGCSKPLNALGYCTMHYKRLKAHGDPLGGRAWLGSGAKWLRDNAAHQGDACLPFPYGRDPSGYRKVYWDGKSEWAHIVMCRLAHGEPPTPDHVAAHNCGRGNQACCNPTHLRYATRSENQMDRIVHGTSNRGSRNGMSKLTEDDVRSMRALKGQMTQARIAERFQVSLGSVRDILANRRWSWLKD